MKKQFLLVLNFIIYKLHQLLQHNKDNKIKMKHNLIKTIFSKP